MSKVKQFDNDWKGFIIIPILCFFPILKLSVNNANVAVCEVRGNPPSGKQLGDKHKTKALPSNHTVGEINVKITIMQIFFIFISSANSNPIGSAFLKFKI